MRWYLHLGLTLALVRTASCVSMPEEFCPVEPIPPPETPGALGGGLEGFDSPYLGHTGSWDGKGGALGGASKDDDLDLEVSMGLRWTLLPIYWRVLEPDGPVDLEQGVPPEWEDVDAFVIAAQARGLNILGHAPIIGGNADGPPEWAGVREEGKSAPADMDAAADFAGKLAARYRPGGTLAREQGWDDSFGVRAWELDNEPSSYKTHWDGQAGDYAEFVTKSAAAIRQADPQAVILTPALSSGSTDDPWLVEALDAYGLQGSPTYVANGAPYSIGPSTDVVSFHVYEGMDRRSIDCTFDNIRTVFEAWESVRGFEYPRKLEYWHTEGNYDFFGSAPEDQRANWRWQFMTRAFAAGIRKVNVMDVSEPERVAMARYVDALPNPFPMRKVELEPLQGQVWAYEHLDSEAPSAGRVWVLWSENGSTGATVDVPVLRSHATAQLPDGTTQVLTAQDGSVRVTLGGDAEISPPVLLIDRP